MKNDNPRSYRLGDLLERLKARAKADQTTQTEIVTRALRNYLDIEEAEIAGRLRDEDGDTRITVRLGNLLEPLEVRATREKKSASILIRRAVKLYLADGRVPQIHEFMDELRKAHADMARVGGNLNRIARLINTDEILAKSELALVHRALIEEFKPLAKLYGRVERELERQKP